MDASSLNSVLHRWFHLRLRLVGVSLLAVLLVVGCGDRDVTFDPGDSEGTNSQTPELPPEYATPQGTVEVLPGIEFHEVPGEYEPVVAIDEEEKTITVWGDATAYVTDVEVGDVLFGSAYEDFAVQVSGVHWDGDEVVFDVIPLVFTNVVHGEWDMELPLQELMEDEYDEEEDISSTGQGLFNNGVVASFGFEEGVFSADGSARLVIDPTFDFRGKIYANLAGRTLMDSEPTVSVEDCGNVLHESSSWGHSLQLCADYLELSLGVRLNAEARAKLEAQLAESIKREKTIVERSFPGVPLGTTPFVLSPTLTVTAKAQAGASATATLEASAQGEVYAPVGFRWHHAQGGSPIGPGDGNLGFSTDGSADAEVEANAGVTVQARLGLNLSIRGMENRVGIGGVGAGADLNAQAQYQPLNPAPPCLSADVTFDPFLSGNLSVWASVGPVSFDWEILDLRHSFGPFTLASWDAGTRFCLEAQQSLVDQLNEQYGEGCEDGDAEDLDEPTCIQEMMEHCFDPPDEGCTGYVDEDLNMLMVWDTGERVESPYNEDGEGENYFYGKDGELCAISELTTDASCGPVEIHYELMESDEVENDEGLEDDEFEELIDDMHEAGEIYLEGDEATSCMQVPFQPGGGTQDESDSVVFDISCPHPEDDTTVTVSAQGCAVGIGQCEFEAVDEMPHGSLGDGGGAW